MLERFSREEPLVAIRPFPACHTNPHALVLDRTRSLSAANIMDNEEEKEEELEENRKKRKRRKPKLSFVVSSDMQTALNHIRLLFPDGLEQPVHLRAARSDPREMSTHPSPCLPLNFAASSSSPLPQSNSFTMSSVTKQADHCLYSPIKLTLLELNLAHRNMQEDPPPLRQHQRSRLLLQRHQRSR